jgi:hypothetical protein
MIIDDCFEATTNDRVIQGELLKCKDGRWNIEGDHLFLAIGTTECVQRWESGKPVETVTAKPLPDIDLLNAAIPRATWEEGLNGPRPPWQRQHAAFFIRPTDGAAFTYITGTIGGRMAIQTLSACVTNMRKLRGENVLPIVALGSKTMKTKFGQRIRPEFIVKDWRRVGTQSASPPAIEDKSTIGTPVTPPTIAEELSDGVPF